MFKFLKSKVLSLTPQVPFDERDIVMGVLRNDPKIMSHVWGAQVHSLQQVKRDDDAAQGLINDILVDIARRFANDPESLSRIMRTMLKTYRIDIDVRRVPAFDRIHSLIGRYVEQNHQNIEVYQ